MKDMKKVVDGILHQGYAVFPMPEKLRVSFEGIPVALAEISPDAKESFSFPSLLDGFLPFGSEHAENNPDHPDLCERFCYFRKNRDEHARYRTASTPFYISIAEYEEGIALLSEVVLSAVFDRLGGQAPKAPGTDSYVQLCRYSAEYAAMGKDRPYLMDPHIDGQLLTFIAQTEQGLMVEKQSRFEPIRFSSGEIFVMAGKLLEIATDGEVKGVLHAVARGESRNPRLAVIYFQNPCFEVGPYASLRSGRSIDFFAEANDIHRSYGNPSY